MKLNEDCGEESSSLQALLDEKEKVQKELNESHNAVILARKAWKARLKFPMLIAIPSLCITGLLRETSYVNIPGVIGFFSISWLMWRFFDSTTFDRYGRDEAVHRQKLFKIMDKLDKLGALSESEQAELREKNTKDKKNKISLYRWLGALLISFSILGWVATVFMFLHDGTVSFIALSFGIIPTTLCALSFIKAHKLRNG